MKKFKFSVVLLFAFALLLGGCKSRVLDFTLISTKNVDMSKSVNFQKGKQRVEGIDLAHWIIAFPTSTVTIKEAVDKAIESTPGCVAILDGVIYSKFWWIPYIYGQQSIIVEGTPLIDPSMASNDNYTPYGKIELNKNGDITNIEKLSSKEYLAMKSKIVNESGKSTFDHSNTMK